MPYGETKVYFDGSHYIAIPHIENPHKRTRYKEPEEEITVADSKVQETAAESKRTEEVGTPENDVSSSDKKITETVEKQTDVKPQKEVKITKKQLFDKLYTDSLNLPKFERKQAIIKGMRPYFKDDETTVNYVTLNLERKYRNLVARRIRLMRKVNLQDFNYFVTLTYNDAIHTEATFKKKLRNTLSHLCVRKGWKYIGVWERSPKKKRLHFHGIFHIPEGSLPGLMTDVNSFSFSERKRQITKQNDYFNTLFGRNDFRPIENKDNVGEAVAYIMKYIEKSGEKIVYSRGLPQYFISDIMDDDIVCPFGQEDKKLLLFDDFTCWDEGCYVGTVSKETIKQMRKSN